MNDRVIQNNIFDEPIEECSCAPLTGFLELVAAKPPNKILVIILFVQS